MGANQLSKSKFNSSVTKSCNSKKNLTVSGDTVSGDFKKFGILKFHDLIKLQNCLFICHLEQDEQLAKSFPA